MNIGEIASVVIAVVALLGITVGGVAWFYKRGGDERELTKAVKDNTHVTGNLADQVGGLRETLEAHSYQLLDHAYRLKALEESPK